MEQSTKLRRKSQRGKGIVAPIKSLTKGIVAKMKHTEPAATAEGGPSGRLAGGACDGGAVGGDAVCTDGAVGAVDGDYCGAVTVLSDMEDHGKEEVALPTASPLVGPRSFSDEVMDTLSPPTGEVDAVEVEEAPDIVTTATALIDCGSLISVEESTWNMDTSEVEPAEAADAVGSALAASASPPCFALTRSDPVRALCSEQRVPSHTPSWADHDSADSHSAFHRDDAHCALKEDEDIDRDEEWMQCLDSRYAALEILCSDLKETVVGLEERLEQQRGAMQAMELRIEGLESPRQSADCALPEEAGQRRELAAPRLKLRRYGWSGELSFARTKWENMYHSLFSYFMNGLMVIFMVFTKLGLFITSLCPKYGAKDASLGNERNRESHFGRGHFRTRKRRTL